MKLLKLNYLLIIIILLFIFSLQGEVDAYSDEYFTFEMGSIIFNKTQDDNDLNFDPLAVVQIGYLKEKDNKFLHVFWGSLNEEQEERTSYIFGEIGYNKKIRESLYNLDFSFGIGRVDINNDYLSTKNMFTERISIGYKDYYISIRHMSNGGKILGNDGRNLGRTNLTFGVKF